MFGQGFDSPQLHLALMHKNANKRKALIFSVLYFLNEAICCKTRQFSGVVLVYFLHLPVRFLQMLILPDPA